MLSKLKPKADINQIFERGTDLVANGRIRETLAFNHFNQHDADNLINLYEKLKHNTPDMLEMFVGYLNEISPDGKCTVDEKMIQQYIHNFFNYMDMKDLKDKLFKINVGTLVVAIILMICNFIVVGDDARMIVLILTSMNTGIIFFNLWLGFQLKKIK